jgi:hypothetical protein
MSLHVVEADSQALRLDGQALRALIAALRFQITDWRDKGPGDVDEDDLADMQNDIQYHEILLDRLEAEYRRINPLQAL